MAAENIDGTTGGTGPFNTSIPGLSDNADIQEALRIYHYGTKTPPSNLAGVTSKSVAGHLKSISDRVQTVESAGIGSGYQANEPTSVPNGYLWVDADSAAPVFDETLVSVPSVVKYQNSQPTTNLKDGMVWVDKDDQFVNTYVYDETGTSWVRTSQVAKYQNAAPSTTNVVEGSLWVDKDSVPLMMYVFDSSVGWRPLGV
jgi:hypothetical protein